MENCESDIFVVAGEASGDLHAGNLVRELRLLQPGLTIRGFAGQCFKEAGGDLLVDLTNFAVMGVRRVFPLLGRLVDVINRFRHEMTVSRPRVVVLIDYPGLNLLLARIAQSAGIPVVYYCCPQLWAWAPWRVKRIRRLSDVLLVIFPFEKQFFEAGSVETQYVGHPLCDELSKLDLKSSRREVRSECRAGEDEVLVGLFPGSRKQEVAELGKFMCRIAGSISRKYRNVRFAFSCLKEEYYSFLPAEGRVGIVRGPGEPLMAACDLAVAASGTASLELAFFRKPMVVTYPLSRAKRKLFGYLSTTPYICTVNLLAKRRVVSEHFVAGKKDALEVQGELERLLRDKEARVRSRQTLNEVAQRYLKPGASRKAAERILAFCDRKGRR